jgi:hypothetical protein
MKKITALLLILVCFELDAQNEKIDLYKGVYYLDTFLHSKPDIIRIHQNAQPLLDTLIKHFKIKTEGEDVIFSYNQYERFSIETFSVIVISESKSIKYTISDSNHFDFEKKTLSSPKTKKRLNSIINKHGIEYHLGLGEDGSDGFIIVKIDKYYRLGVYFLNDWHPEWIPKEVVY